MFAASRTAASATATLPAVACPPLPASLELCPACQGEGWAGKGWCYCPVGSQLASEDRAWRFQFTWQQAAIPAELTGRRIETWPGDAPVRDYLLNWVGRWQGKQGPSLVLTGKARSGKTGLVLGLVYRLIEKMVSEGVPSFTMRFVTAYDLMAALTSWRGREERFKSYLDCDLLILDDLGREPAWDSNVANLTRVVMHRYNHQLPLMATSNLSLGEIEARLGQRRRCGDRQAAGDGDRLHGRGLRRVMRGGDCGAPAALPREGCCCRQRKYDAIRFRFNNNNNPNALGRRSRWDGQAAVAVGEAPAALRGKVVVVVASVNTMRSG